MKKRILSIIIAMTMLFTMAVFQSTGAIAAAPFGDVAGTDYEKAVTVLYSLGIMGGYTDGTFQPFNTITRAEMAAICVRMVGITDLDIVSPEEVQYTDMDGHWAAGYVAVAHALGIAEGLGDGTFAPDMSITYPQAVKMVVAALGYDLLARTQGGYPSGYLARASELGLLKGVSVTDGNIPRGAVAKIVYNALTADLMLAVGYKEDGTVTEYEVRDNQNILNTYFNIEELRGIVFANDATNLEGGEILKEGRVKIGEEVFNVGTTDVDKYLGYYVRFYAEDADSNDYRTIIAYAVESVKNNVLEIDAEDIEDVSVSSKGYTVEYRNGANAKKNKTATTSSTPLVIYNGAALDDVVAADMMPEVGKVTLIDNDGDDRYDIVDIYDYTIFCVLTVSASTGDITDRYGHGSVRIDVDDDDYTGRILDKYGNTVSINSISPYSVLAIAISRDGSVRTAIVSNESVYGTVSARDIEDDKIFYTINGVQYEAANAVTSRVGVGDTGTFYISPFGKLEGVKGNKNVSLNAGILIGIDYHSKLTGVLFEFYNSDGEVVDTYLADKVKVNNQSVKWSDEDVYNANLFTLHTTYSNRAGKDIYTAETALFLYKLDKSGKICELVTASSDGSTGLKSEIPDRYHYNEYYYDGYKFYNSTYKVLVAGGGYKPITYLSENLIAFYSADNYTKTSPYQIYEVGGVSSLSRSLRYYDVATYQVYDINASGRAVSRGDYVDFLYCLDDYDTEGETSDTDHDTYSEPIKIVERVSKVWDSTEGEEVYKLYYWQAGSLRNNVFKYDELVAPNGREWKKGDFVRMRLTENKISRIWSLFYNGSTGDLGRYNGTNFGYTAWNEPENMREDRTFRYPSQLYSHYYDYRATYMVGRVLTVTEDNNQSVVKVIFDDANSTINHPGATPADPADSGAKYVVWSRDTRDEVALDIILGNVYRVEYSDSGQFAGVERLSAGAVVPGQLVLMRFYGRQGSIYYTMQETYILYDDCPDEGLNQCYDEIHDQYEE